MKRKKARNKEENGKLNYSENYSHRSYTHFANAKGFLGLLAQ